MCAPVSNAQVGTLGHTHVHITPHPPDERRVREDGGEKELRLREALDLFQPQARPAVGPACG